MGEVEPYKRFILILCIVILVLWSALLSSCDQETPHPAGPSVPAAPMDGWTKIGNVSDSLGGCSVWRKKDDNGKIVYVAIGVNACSVTVTDESKK